MIVHVEVAPRLTFCGEHPMALASEAPDDRVIQSDAWIAEVEQVQYATCEGCLRRIFMLGDSASIALRKLGRVIEVHDVDAVSLQEN